MANRYWNPAADANWGDANVWATTDGGDPTGVATPTSSDDVFFSNTNSHKCTIAATANCLSLNFTYGTGFTGILAGVSQLNIYGSLTLNGGMSLTYSGTLSIQTNNAGPYTINFNGKALSASIQFQGGTGTRQLLSNISITSFNFVNGTFDPNNYTVTLTGQTMTLGTGSGLTFYNLTISPASPSKTDSLSLGNNVSVTNNLTISDGATLTNRIFIYSTVIGTSRTITCTGASVNYSNTDFQDITISGGTLGTNNSVGDCGNNSGITFTGSADQHWTNANGGNWSASGNWTSRVPLPQDNVFFDCAFNTSKTVTADMPRLGKSIDWTGATWTTALSFTISTSTSFYGSLTLISGLNYNGNQHFSFNGRSSYTLKTFSVNMGGQGLDIKGVGGTLQLLDDIIFTSGNGISLYSGTFDANNFNVSVLGFSVNFAVGTLARIIIMGSGTWEMTGVSIDPLWYVVDNTYLTITPGTSTIKYTDTGNNQHSFYGGGKTYNKVWFARGASTGNIIIAGSNTFGEIKDDGTEAHSIIFTAGTTQHYTTFNVNGHSAKLIILTSTTTGVYYFIKDGGGTVSCDYLDIYHCVATPADRVWYAGKNSVNHQATAVAGSGWIFDAAPTIYAITKAVQYCLKSTPSAATKSMEYYIPPPPTEMVWHFPKVPLRPRIFRPGTAK